MASLAQPIARVRTKPITTFAQIMPALILFYSFFIPPEIDVNLGPLRFGIYRLTLLALLPYVVIAIFTGKLRFKAIDILVLIIAGWLTVSFSMVYNWRTGLEAGGGHSFDMVLAYLLGRSTIRSFDHVRLLLVGILPGLLAVSALLALESLSGSLLVRSNLQALFGGSEDYWRALKIEYRRGLLRAYSVFTHPIHAGIFLSSFIPLYIMFFRQPNYKGAGLAVGFLGVFSLSSAAILGIAINLALIFYDWLQQRVKDLGWGLFLIVSGTVLVALQLFSQGGVVAIVYRYLTLNPATGYFRTLIWKYASDEAIRHPFFGIGYEDYYRPLWMNTNSVDAHYLSMATVYGLIPALLYFFVTIICIVILGRRASQTSTTFARNRFVGLAICMSVVVLLMFTVTFWGAMLAWWNFFLGMAISLTSFRPNLQYRANQ